MVLRCRGAFESVRSSQGGWNIWIDTIRQYWKTRVGFGVLPSLWAPMDVSFLMVRYDLFESNWTRSKEAIVLHQALMKDEG